jgi:hypothetical protein
MILGTVGEGKLLMEIELRENGSLAFCQGKISRDVGGNYQTSEEAAEFLRSTYADPQWKLKLKI